MKEPTVSVGLPVFNGARYLRRALDSLLGQNFGDFELIISDNASEDETQEICRTYGQADRRIRYLRNELNIGAAGNHRRVFELGRGQFFKWAGHDDEVHPAMLTQCVNCLRAEPDRIVLAYPQCELINETGDSLGLVSTAIGSQDSRPHRRLRQVLRGVSLGSPVYGVAARDALRKTRLIDSFYASDYVLLAELAMLGQIREVPAPLLRLRRHHGDSLRTNPNKASLEAWLDTSRKPKRMSLPVHERLVREYVRSITRLPLGAGERWMCFATAVSVPYGRRLRNLAGRQKRRILTWMRRRG